jgi:hypothetical protein
MRRTQLVHKISARGIYTSGKGSSSVGLTAYVTKDPETKELVLERCGDDVFRKYMVYLIDVDSRACFNMSSVAQAAAMKHVPSCPSQWRACFE